jgi:hypothetical protein
MRAFFCLLDCCAVLEGLFASRLAPTGSDVDTLDVNTPLSTVGAGLLAKAIMQSPQKPQAQPPPPTHPSSAWHRAQNTAKPGPETPW